MSDAELIAMVERMRVNQREYFRTKDRGTLAISKDLERRVDAELARRAKPPTLFDPNEA